LRQVGRPEDDDRPRLLAKQQRDLDHSDCEARVQQERQDHDHEQRAAVANLVANLPQKDETDVLPVHRAAMLSSAREMSPKNSSSKSLW
jgi:hypothetical protein